MRRIPKTFTALAIAVLALAYPGISRRARAAGLLVADGGFGGVLEIKEHEVRVSLNNGIAVTHVRQVFHNTENRQVEALYTFPVPKGASVANFSMWINGKEMVGEVLEKERAREIYNSYKRRKRDPGLLEQKDFKTFEMRIFPIAPNADQRVEITYYQELDVDHDWFTYVYPLATATRQDVDDRTTGRFAFDLEVKSAVPLVELESPSHAGDFVLAKHTDSYWQASLETREGSLARDIVVAGHLSRPRTGVDLITANRKDEDGYFLLSLTAGEDLGKVEEGMDYIFVADISGSMANDSKLAMSKRSIGAFADALGEKDRFEIMTFNVQPTPLFGELRPATEEMRREGFAFLEQQAAKGGTRLHPALSTAYKYSDPDRRLNVVVLSDGMTEQRSRQVLLELIRQRPRNCRVFCVGVGNEVNRALLQQLAQDTGGLAAFISRGDNFGRKASAFRRKLMRPAVSDLTLVADGIDLYDIVPEQLPDLYHGTPVRIFGRYRGSGNAKLSFSGDIRGVAFKETAELNFPELDEENPEIERSWAWHRIDALQKKADRTGSRDAVVDQIVALGEAYSIVTEYTSFLVLENDAEYKRWKIDRRNRDRVARDRAAQSRRSDALEAMREKAVADLGPQAVRTASVPKATPSTPGQQVQSSRPARPANQSFDFGGGTGPVGPLFLVVAGWARRKRKRA